MQTRRNLSDLIEGRLSSPQGRSQLVDLATRLIIEEALEAEARDVTGRKYYEHGVEPGQGYRNGNRTAQLKTAEGAIDCSAPQLAGRDEPFRSRIRSELKGNTGRLESLAVEMLARGLSVRDIEDAFRDESGSLLLSRTAVSEIGERLWRDYQDFCSRDLGEYDVSYLFVDGIAERIRPGQRREPIMAAWGITSQGNKVLLGLMTGSKEDHETVCAFFQDMRNRNLGEPLLVVSDGAAGIIKAIEICFPRSERQRCLAHRMRNLACKVPESQWPDFKELARSACQPPHGLLPAMRPRNSPTSSESRFRVHSPALRMILMPALPTFACRSVAVGRSGRPTFLSGCSWRSAAVSRSFRTLGVRSLC